ncbi:MAG: hypothetical protein LBI27_01520 [Clostridiales bacterium]|nr:hypothetical protein [Clostridiales bacterium]
MNGIILKDDARYVHTENYLRSKGYVFDGEASLDFIIFPFKEGIDETKYDDKFFAALGKGTKIFSGIRNAYITKKCERHGLDYRALMEDRGVAIKNAVPTSEGVISYLIANRDETIANSRILVIGYGICGRDLCKRLAELGAKVSALVRSREKECTAYSAGIKPVYLSEPKEHFDVIINTAPAPVLTDEMLERTNGALLIDIASGPFGFDISLAQKLNEKSARLLGIPGKCAVKTAGKILAEYIHEILNGGLR